MRLLLVEDNPGDVRLIQELLRDSGSGVSITVATNLVDTFSHAARSSFDAVLLDLNLPDSNGLATLHALIPTLHNTPIIVLTAQETEHQGLAAIKAGAQDYLPKAELSHSLLLRALRYGKQRMTLQNNVCKVLEHNLDPTLVITRKGEVVYENATVRDTIDSKHLEKIKQKLFNNDDEQLMSRQELELNWSENETRIFIMSTSLIKWEQHSETYLISLHDVTEIKKVQLCLEESNRALQSMVLANADTLRLSSKILETMAEGVVVTDADRRITAVNPAFTRLTGFWVSEVIGRDPKILQSGLHGEKFYSEMWQELAEKGRWEGEIWNRHRTGRVYCVQESINVIRNSDGSISHYVSILRDVTERVEREKIILDQALHDSLTGLANRTLLKETLQQNILLASRKGYKVGILFIDIDNFKTINDAFGHTLGDWLLCEMAARMRACARASDLVARMGGDEFVIVLPDVMGVGCVEAATDHIISELRKPYTDEVTILDISFSIGISIWPDHGDNTEELLQRADIAMYEVKRSGKGDWRVAGNSEL